MIRYIDIIVLDELLNGKFRLIGECYKDMNEIAGIYEFFLDLGLYNEGLIPNTVKNFSFNAYKLKYIVK